MHFDQNIVLIIVAAVIGISRLVARIAENSRQQSQRREGQASQPSQPQGRIVVTTPKTDEERVREFLDALGVPKDATPPAKVPPRSGIPPRPVAPIPPPPISRPFSTVLLKPVAEKVRRILTPPSLPVAKAPSAASETDAPGAWLRQEEKIESAAAKFEAATRVVEDEGAAVRAGTLVDWQNALRSRESVRAALVLREILGPPKALRET